jgi:hypothetical protein
MSFSFLFLPFISLNIDELKNDVKKWNIFVGRYWVKVLFSDLKLMNIFEEHS